MRRLARWIGRLYYRRKVQKAMEVMRDLDNIMVKAGYARHERRRIWREFVKASLKDKDSLIREVSKLGG